MLAGVSILNYLFLIGLALFSSASGAVLVMLLSLIRTERFRNSDLVDGPGFKGKDL